MITTAHLKLLARARLKDAQVLYSNKRYDAAVYVCGYAVEVALKARICLTLKWAGFPDTRKEFEGYASFRTHDLDDLLHLSGIEPRIRAVYITEWSISRAWNPEQRYRPVGLVTQADAQAMIAAVKALIKVI